MTLLSFCIPYRERCLFSKKNFEFASAKCFDRKRQQPILGANLVRRDPENFFSLPFLQNNLLETDKVKMIMKK